MKTLFLFLSLFFVATWGFAQKITIKGSLSDSTSKSIEFATVMLLKAKDSSLATFGRTMENGSFQIGNIPADNYIFKATFLGYKTVTQSISKSQSGVIDLGKIVMIEELTTLKEFTVKGERPPVSFKKDTIEFDAEAFKTLPNATVEELLKKMPGVEVDKDGNITVNGEKVEKITVNGKNFFGTDPKVATQNLASKAISKIQVYDKKSDMAMFSGIEDGQKEKTINLELKEDFKNSSFGNFMAGGGDNDRYETKASFNKFSMKQQFSVLGMGNNVNKQGFTFQDLANFSGSSQRMQTGGGGGGGRGGVQSSGAQLANNAPNYGFMNNWAGGVNFNREFSKKTDLQSSYFFNRMDRDINQTTQTINFLPNGSFQSNQSNDQNTLNLNHRVNLILEHKFDSANNIKLTANGGYTQNTGTNNSKSETFNNENVKQNQSDRKSLTDTENKSVNATLLYRHRYKKKGRFVSLTGNFALNDANSNGTLNSLNEYFGTINRSETLNQINTQNNSSKTFGATISHTEPVGKRKYLEFNYNYSFTGNKVDRTVYDVAVGENIFNNKLSNNYTTDYNYHRAGANYKWNSKKVTITTGLSLQNSTLQGYLPLFDTKINRNFTNILPVFRLNYDVEQSKRAAFFYETSVREPSVSQLQPVVDNSDPLNISTGNPDLKAEYQHRINANFYTFDPIKFVNFFINGNVNYTTNKIVYGQFVDNRFIRTVKPVNVANDLNATTNANLGFPINKLKSRMNFTSGYTFNRGINILNNAETFTTAHIVRGTARYQFNYKENFEWSVSANLSRQMTQFQAANAPDQIYDNQTYTTEMNWNVKGFVFASSLNYLIYKSQTTNFSQKLPLLNASISKMVFKDKSGEIKLAVVNALDRKVGVEQQTSANYLQQSTILSLGRYTMLSFTYSLNKALNPAQGMGRGGRGGGMMMQMR